MKVKANPWAVGIASVVNGAILALFIFLGIKTIIQQKKDLVVTPVDLKTDYLAPKKKVPDAPGGGGGSPDKIEAIKGKIPPKAPTSIEFQAHPAAYTHNRCSEGHQDSGPPDTAELRLSNSPNVKLASSGNGTGMGLGNGHGGGYGDGSGGNAGGGLYHVGGEVSSPVAIFEPEAEFSDEARRAKFQGVVVVYLIVDAQGNPQNVKVSQSLGMGLDEKAIEAVRKYKFKPAMYHGKPVPVPINIEVNFRLY